MSFKTLFLEEEMKLELWTLFYYLIIISINIIILWSCENILPSDFQKDKDYDISNIDDKACSLLSKELSKTDTLISGADTTFSTTNYYLPITVAYLNQSIQESWINAPDTLINTLYDTLLRDTILLVKNPAVSDTGYVLYDQLAQKTNTNFYISWDLNEDNVDAYINIEIFAQNGENNKYISTGIKLESVAGCTQTIETGGVEQTFPKIRARYVYKLPTGLYLVRFYISEPNTVGNFRVVIL